MDDLKHEAYKKEMYTYEERTEHKGILPAAQRLKQYKIKTIRRPPQSAV